ncbi:hypothetical protein CKO36_15340 [Rhabdochromatium marinum]|nr:hypothetical protein [Rhabdochromatium marinum]
MYLHRTAPMNPDSAYYKGRYEGVDISVEARQNTDRVASILLKALFFLYLLALVGRSSRPERFTAQQVLARPRKGDAASVAVTETAS